MRLPLSAYVLTGGGLVAGALLAAPGAAYASWSVESDGGAATARAAELPAVGSPEARPGRSTSSVIVSWPTIDLAGGYHLSRIDTVTGAAAGLVGGCAGVITGTTCADIDVPDGRWTYRVRAVLGASWTGPWSTHGDPILVDTTPIKAAIGFPAVGGRYDTGSFDGCGTTGFCGTATPAGGTELTDVRVSLKQGDSYWNPATGAFSGSAEILFPVEHRGGTWLSGFDVDDFRNGNPAYTLRVVARDDAGGSTDDTATFHFKSEKPEPAAVQKPAEPVDASKPGNVTDPVPADDPGAISPESGESSPGSGESGEGSGPAGDGSGPAGGSSGPDGGTKPGDDSDAGNESDESEKPGKSEKPDEASKPDEDTEPEKSAEPEKSVEPEKTPETDDGKGKDDGKAKKEDAAEAEQS